jgi:hypothetical protein
VWWRRAVLLLVATVPVLALLDVFGQHAAPVSYQNPVASAAINSPVHVRGGLVFTTEIVITPHQQLNDAQLYLDNGWFEAMTFNGVAPQPSSESSHGRWLIWDFGKLPAGTPFHVWISWQTNPTNIGQHSQALALDNGGIRVMTIQRTITILP